MIEKILCEIRRMLKTNERLLIAIDGRCASGKTTLAKNLNKKLCCNVIHADDFFLRPEQRTPERYNEPGGNLDRERLLKEVLLPLKTEEAFFYRPFDCHMMALREPITVNPNKITIIEGTYSCHPELWKFYDLHIFLTTAYEKQLQRLQKRNVANIQIFLDKWIFLEERYFKECKPETNCELVFET